MTQSEIGIFEILWAVCGIIFYILLFTKKPSHKWKYVSVGLFPFMARSYYLAWINNPIKNLPFLLEGIRGYLYSNHYQDRHKLLIAFAAMTLFPLINTVGFFETINQVLFSVGTLLAIGYTFTAYKDISNGEHVADHILITMVAMAWFYKICYGYQLGISPLLVRGGGVYASNQIIGVILALLPFSINRWVRYASILTVLLQFSRGGFVALFILLLICVWQRNERFKINSAAIIYAILIALAGWLIILLSSHFSGINIIDFIVLRVFGGGSYGLNVSLVESLSFNSIGEVLDQFFASLMNDDRFLIWSAALKIAEESNYLGVGTGNFHAYALKFNDELSYSNAHNIFLTILVEQGFFALMVFIAALAVYLKRAYKYSSSGFSSLAVFSIYGMYSGQIYEVSFENTIVQYIILIIVFAYIDVSASNVRNGRDGKW